MVSIKLGKETLLMACLEGAWNSLALLLAVGSDGRNVLQSSGFDSHDQSTKYEQAMKHLASVYCSEENMYVRIMKFVTASVWKSVHYKLI